MKLAPTVAFVALASTSSGCLLNWAYTGGADAGDVALSDGVGADSTTDLGVTDARDGSVTTDGPLPDTTPTAILPPRPIAPLSTSSVTSQQPTLRWQLAAGSDGAVVDLCRDRAFSMACQSIMATGGSGAPTAALAVGPWFWRLRGTAGGVAGTQTGPIWEFHVGARSAPVDTSWGTTLDVNGDGFADVIVGDNGTAMGNAYVYLGSGSGIATTPSTTLAGPDAAVLTFQYGRFGDSVASAGDVNGDGFADVVVAASGAVSTTGRAYVYLGSATGLATSPAFTLTGPDGSGGLFGCSVASAGDVNGDGFADLVVGASGAASTGRAYLYLGSATGLATTPATSLTATDTIEQFGSTVASAGDVNGDGFADVVVGALPESGAVSGPYLFLGSHTGLAASPSMTLANNTARGSPAASAGDVNGDGYADVLVGGAALGVAQVFVYHGSANGLAIAPTTTITENTVPDAGYDGFAEQYGSQDTVAGAGDVNGDGYADIIIGAWRTNGFRGEAYIYTGSASGLSSNTYQPIGTGGATSFGFSVAAAGDIVGNGYSGVVVGAPDNGGAGGRAYVFLGGSSGINGANVATPLAAPNGMGGDFGVSIARRSTDRVTSPTPACRSDESATRARCSV